MRDSPAQVLQVDGKPYHARLTMNVLSLQSHRLLLSSGNSNKVFFSFRQDGSLGERQAERPWAVVWLKLHCSLKKMKRLRVPLPTILVHSPLLQTFKMKSFYMLLSSGDVLRQIFQILHG